VGNDPFRDAIRSYITKHDGKNVTSRDFVGVLSTISTDAGAVMGTYLDLGGAPVVKLDVQCAGKPVIEVRAATGTVPVCVRYPDGTGIARTCVAASAKAGSIFPPACPAWVIGNANGDGYYRIADPSHAAKAPSTPSERLTYADDLAAGVLRGDVPLAVALAESSLLSRSKDSAGVLAGALIASAIDPFVEDGVRPAWKRWLTARFGAWTKRKIVTAVDSELGEQPSAVLASVEVDVDVFPALDG
jgi:hypothetical protein